MSTLTATPSISMMDLRKEPGTVLDRVDYRNENLVITRANKPKAVLISVREFEQMQQLKQQAKTKLFSIIDKVQSSSSSYDEKDIQQAITEGIVAVREK